MISEERLKEIVEQQGTIYCSSGKVWFPIRFTDHIGRIRDGYFYYRANGRPDFCCWSEEIALENLFETEEEAIEYLKYGNVTRTEKFPYVSWEEFCKDGHLQFLNFAHKWCCIYMDKDFLYLVRYYGKRHRETYMKLYVSKENYHKELDIAVKLFKGEEV